MGDEGEIVCTVRWMGGLTCAEFT